MESALAAFEAAGYERIDHLDGLRDTDLVLGVDDGGAELLREADRRGIKYVLVHDGDDDGHPGGTYERAHHRIEAAQREELAKHLRSRVRPLVTCLAFAYKNGAPAEAALLIDARFLDNPYWVPELRPLTGLDAPVRDFVLGQPPAVALLDGLEATLGPLLDEYRQRGRMELTIAFGCTGGRHRSVSMAREMAERLGRRRDVEVEFRARELGP